MKIRDEITLYPSAKINLYLKIRGKRSDGYHELETVLHPIALRDELVIRLSDMGLKVECCKEDLPFGQEVPAGSSNLIYKAAELFFRQINKEPSVEIQLLKRIPLGGGLGGGSSDAANTVLGLNRLFGDPLTEIELQKICSKIGMDVPFFLDPRPAICKGRGEVIEKRFKNMNFWCVLVNPGKELPTKNVYSSINLILTEPKTEDNISRFEQGRSVRELAEHIENDLERPAIQLCPDIRDILNVLNGVGAIRSFVCGSGATVCGLAVSKQNAEEVMAGVLETAPGSWWVKAVSSC